MSQPRFSQHPVDRLIRDLIATHRDASAAEVRAILDRLATAPFSTRQVSTRAEHRGYVFHGRPLGARETSLRYHLFRRMMLDSEWGYRTSEVDYVADLHRIAQAENVALAIYLRRGGPMAIAFAPTVAVMPSDRRGTGSKLYIGVFYAADWGTITSGYQFPDFRDLSIPEDIQWLKRP